MTNRRSVLQFLGFAPVAAPIAAKAVSDQAIADLAGISNIPNGVPSGSGISAGVQVTGEVNDWKSKVVRFLADKTLPHWFEEELRERNRYVWYLDPDIACKRSWSMNFKIVVQRQRNIERARIEALKGPQRGLRSREFEEKYGVWL